MHCYKSFLASLSALCILMLIHNKKIKHVRTSSAAVQVFQGSLATLDQETLLIISIYSLRYTFPVHRETPFLVIFKAVSWGSKRRTHE